MYIKLGTIGVNYFTPPIDDFMIFSEVPNTTISYESPVIIRTSEELDIWFGKTSPDYPNLYEILKSNGKLYLYRPISKNTYSDVNIDSWEGVYSYDNGEKQIPFPESFLSSTPYIDKDGNVLNLDPRSDKKYNVNGVWYIWYNNNWVSESELPQNISNISLSLNNRDTLLLASKAYSYADDNDTNTRLLWDGDSKLKVGDTVYTYSNGDILRESDGGHTFKGVNYTLLDGKVESIFGDIEPSGYTYKTYTCSPQYDDETKDIVSPDESDYRLSKISIVPETSGNTYAIKFIFPKTDNLGSINLENGYFRYKDQSGQYICFLFGDTEESDPEIQDLINPEEDIIIPGIRTLSDLLSDSNLQKFDQIGVKEDGEISLVVKDKTGKFEYSNIFSSTNEEISVKIDDWTNNILLYKYIVDSNLPSIFFCSKTIGTDDSIDPEKDITINIEYLDNDEYRIDISRYGYTECFIGKLNSIEDRIDYKITRDSKLTRCWLLQGLGEIEDDIVLESGEYKMSGAWVESYTKENYFQSLKAMFDLSGEPVYPDFFMVPDLSLWGEDKDRPDEVDEVFLEYAKNYNTQFLIAEETKSEAEGNLLTDKENRLVYFYGDLKVSDVKLPAYYPFIMGSLTNTFVYTARKIENSIYWDDEDEELIIRPYSTQEYEIDRHKCNYLVSNNQKYYYRKYNSGKNYSTTAWRRFIIGKVYRELAKNKWDYIGMRLDGLVRNKIEEILNKIALNFSIVRGIGISEYQSNPKTNSIDLVIDIYTTDLVDDNIKLDITINI